MLSNKEMWGNYISSYVLGHFYINKPVYDYVKISEHRKNQTQETRAYFWQQTAYA